MWGWQSPAGGIGNPLGVGLTIPETLFFGVGDPRKLVFEIEILGREIGWEIWVGNLGKELLKLEKIFFILRCWAGVGVGGGIVCPKVAWLMLTPTPLPPKCKSRIGSSSSQTRR